MIDNKTLIVEDENIIAIDLQRRLERFGYSVVAIASKGEDAIELVQQHLPNIILMDIMLAGDLDGIETATIIHNEHNIPVIFLTAYSDEKTLERAKSAKPYGYLLKPFKDKELHTTIDIALYKHRVENELKRQQRWSSAILHSIGDAIIATGTDDRIILLNPMAEKLTGWRESDIIGKSIPEVIVLEAMEESGGNRINLPGGEILRKRKIPFTFKNCYFTNKFGENLQVEGGISAITNKAGDIEGIVMTMRDVTAFNRLTKAIEYHSSHDKLTNISNRESFAMELEKILSNLAEGGLTYILAILDIDRFKIINETCGHSVADKMLINMAKFLLEFAQDPGYCARLGADQFGLIVGADNFNKAVAMINSFHKSLSTKKLEWGSSIFPFDTSAGVTVINKSSDSVSKILAEADDACLLSKEEGGARIRVYDKKETQFLKRRGEMEWVSKLTKALSEDRFDLYIQEIRPIGNIRNSYSKGEVLIRMRDEDGSTIMPADFIPAAERYNMMAQIDRWVVSNAIKYYKMNIKNGRLNHIREISINLSAPSISDGGIMDFIYQEFESSGISPREICFEITETSTISDMSAAHDFINKLKHTGCTFALDDFGSGFSSFNYLKNLPVDYLKIDGIFIKNLHEDSENRAIVAAINNMGHIMGKKTIAEFVCNPMIVQILTSIGVDFAQGYEVSKPVRMVPEN